MVAIVGVSACGPKLVPLPPTERRPEPVPAPVVVPVLPTRFTIPSVVPEHPYRLQSVTELERDSAGKKETRRFTSQANVFVRMQRNTDGGFEAAGRIRGYTITPSLSTTPVVIDSLRFDALLNPTMLRVVSQPLLANECDRPETGALTLVRDLLVRVPATVSIGERWRDSTIHIVCRSNVPMTVRTTSEYEVTQTMRRDDGIHVTVRRTSATRMEGKTTSSWRLLEVTGVGTGMLTADVAVMSGAVTRVSGNSTMVLTVTDSGAPVAQRTQQVTQRVTYTAESLAR